ncbi:hypothetical protein ACQJ0O_07795 [Pseudomonas shirazensis]|uniref:hypothetical protein n=1 Tax=Pseudomonas shirazensis TaxID=2745494 RepID=UPI003D074B06
MYKYILAALILPIFSTADALADEKFNIFGMTPGQSLTQAQLNTSIENVSTNINLAEDAEFPAIDTSQSKPYQIYEYPLYGEFEKFSMTLIVLPNEKIYIVESIRLQAQYENLLQAPNFASLKDFILKKYGKISHISLDQIRSDGTRDYLDYRVLFKSGKTGSTSDSLNQCSFDKTNGPKGFNDNCKTVMSFNAYAKPIKNNSTHELITANFEIAIQDIEVAGDFLTAPTLSHIPKN